MAVRALSDVVALERTPLAERNLPPSTFAMLRASAERFGDKAALRHLTQGLPEEPTRDVSFRELFRRVTQAANLFHELGVTPETSVSMLLPLTPETFVTLIGAETAGMANPINPLLEPPQIASLLTEAKARVLVAPDPDLLPGFWPKVEATLALAPSVKHVLRSAGRPSAPTSRREALRPKSPASPPTSSSSSARSGPTTSRPCSIPAARRRCQNSRATPIAGSRCTPS